MEKGNDCVKDSLSDPVFLSLSWSSSSGQGSGVSPIDQPEALSAI